MDSWISQNSEGVLKLTLCFKKDVTVKKLLEELMECKEKQGVKYKKFLPKKRENQNGYTYYVFEEDTRFLSEYKI